MIRNRAFTLLLLMPLLLVLIPCTAHAANTTRVSVASDGTQGNNDSYSSLSVSEDGRYVVFGSSATNLVTGDTNEAEDIFIHDRQTGQTERVSVSSNGTQNNDHSFAPSISRDGRYVAFWTYGSNLVTGDTNGKEDIFVRDRQTGQTERVSVSSNGTQSNSNCLNPSISGDGRYVAFQSLASNLVTGDTNGKEDIFVHDRQTGQTERVSVSSNGTQNNDQSFAPSISGDGRYVTFSSEATNLVPEDTNGVRDVFVHDRQTGQTERISVSSNGTQGNDDAESWGYSISGDGRYVTFSSEATNFVPEDTNGVCDVFVHDRQTGQTERISVSSNGTQGNDISESPSINANGRYIVFESDATNFISVEIYVTGNIYVHDRQTGLTEIVSVSNNNIPGYYWSREPYISANGRYVAFTSFANNLVPGDTNDKFDVFLRDRLATIRNHKFDINKDGNDDLVGLDSDDWVWYSTNKTNWVKIQGKLSKVALGDIDGDGNDDIAGIYAGSVYYTTNKILWTEIPGAMSILSAGDYNGDGKDDLAGLNAAGKTYYTTNKTSWKNIPGTLTKLVSGDFNGDGKDDLAGLSSAGKVYYSTNKTTWLGINGNCTNLTVGDLNGDGSDDIIGLTAAGKIYYTTNKTSWKNIPGTLAKLVSGDFNGDGMDDIAGVNAMGRIYYSTNKTSWVRIPGALTSLATGDFNGDGEDDLAGLTTARMIYYSTDKTSWTNIPGIFAQIYSAR